MKVFDCFTFFNELEILELRLMTLDECVDYFVLVESNKTHTGKSKNFVFDENKDKFSKYIDKIIYVQVEDLPEYSLNNIWLAENFQRNCINRGLDKIVDGDQVIISDVDEIPNPDIIKQYINSDRIVVMQQKLFYYHVNCLQNQLWCGSIMATYPKYESPQWLRNVARGSNQHVVENGGWHYSYMGGAEKVKLKVENIAESHAIIDSVGDINTIEKKMSIQQDLWNRTNYEAQKQIVDINIEGMAPKCINDFIIKYSDFYFTR